MCKRSKWFFSIALQSYMNFIPSIMQILLSVLDIWRSDIVSD